MKEDATGWQFRLMRNLAMAITMSAVVIALGVRGLEQKDQRERTRVVQLPINDDTAWRELYARSLWLLGPPDGIPDLDSLPEIDPDPWFEHPGLRRDHLWPVFRQLEDWEPDSAL